MDNRKSVAYFCMEYGIENNVKLYAGGLGILAGDYMKEACDQGYPIVGIGILWKQGYGEQLIDQETGMPYDAYKTGFTHSLRIPGSPHRCASKRDVK